jgi:hypothetical protein
MREGKGPFCVQFDFLLRMQNEFFVRSSFYVGSPNGTHYEGRLILNEDSQNPGKFTMRFPHSSVREEYWVVATSEVGSTTDEYSWAGNL